MSKKKVSCLGFGIHYVNKKTNEINRYDFDLISDYEGSTAQDVIKNFKYIISLKNFQEIDENDYIVWADCGTQLRCAEFNFFLFDELARYGKSVSMNWWCEKHGKNLRDQHFSVVSKSINHAKFKLKTSFKDAQQVVDYLNSTFNQNEKLRLTNTSIAFYYNLPLKETVDIGRREIVDLNCYYNLQNERSSDGNFGFFSTLYSDLTDLLPVDCLVDLHPNQKNFRTINAESKKVIEASNEEEGKLLMTI